MYYIRIFQQKEIVIGIWNSIFQIEEYSTTLRLLAEFTVESLRVSVESFVLWKLRMFLIHLFIFRLDDGVFRQQFVFSVEFLAANGDFGTIFEKSGDIFYFF